MVLTNREKQARYRNALKMARSLRPLTAADREFARQRIAFYSSEKSIAQRAIQRIDEGMTFHEATLERPTMHDVTDQYRADQERRIEMFDDLIRVWSRDLDEEET